MDSRIHLVFHVSQLKPSVGRHSPSTTLPPALSIPATSDFELAPIIANRTMEHGSTSVSQLLVQWQGRSPNEATWVDRTDFMRQFPSYSLEGKASFQGKGIVTNSGQTTVKRVPRIPQPILVYKRRPRKDM
ncbi:Chromo domain-containing protein [Heracleum sosnowskyi]|uniref:Chromo domain-containing protein n=1 Tax=Heracleum sosnowskyi TaxID=360622 RepID=A0AAD8JML5_9APIA|nr:Chromo domain-containing protein [Heracleum sosnowskyi]